MSDSTPKWVTHSAVMLHALRLHDRLIHSAIKNWNGVRFGGDGDAHCVVFDSPVQAINAAIEANLLLQEAEWGDAPRLQIRAGVHVGEVIVEEGAFYGKELSHVARLMSCAHAGQIVVSHTAYPLSNDNPDFGLKLLGSYEFKGLNGFYAVYQVLHPSLPESYPPLNTKGGNNLPEGRRYTPRRRLLQIENEIRAVEESSLLFRALRQPDVKLATVIGGFGTGKTTIAEQAGVAALKDFQHGVWRIDLAGIPDDSNLQAVIECLAPVLSLDTELSLDELANALKDKNLLLILDNCEHLLDSVRQICIALLKRCPRVKILATSRQKIGIQEENLFPIHSFNTLSDARRKSAEEIAMQTIEREDMLNFFKSYAKGLGALWSPEENLKAIAICNELEGNLLAIELIATRAERTQIGTDNLSALLAELSKGVQNIKSDFLRPDHQMSLQAAIKTSFERLDKPQKRLLCRLCVFAAEWSGSAAMAISKGLGVKDSTDEILGRLRAISLISAHDYVQEKTDAGQKTIPYYRIPRAVRDFGIAQLKSKELVATHGLIADYYYKSLAEYVELNLDQDAISGIESLTRFYLYDDPHWLRRRQEWLYHSTFQTNRSIARLQFVQIFLTAFWWWDEYVPFPFSEEILDRWRRTQKEKEDRELGDLLNRIRSRYPRMRNWRNRAENANWVFVENDFLKLKKSVESDLSLSKNAFSKEKDVLLSLIELYLGEAISFVERDDEGDEKRREEAVKLLESSIRTLAANSDLNWSVPFVYGSLAEIHLNQRDDARVLESIRSGIISLAPNKINGKQAFRHHTEQSLKRRISKSKTDYESESRLYRSLGDLFLLRSKTGSGTEKAETLQKAMSLYLLSVWTAYLFQFDPHLPDHYNTEHYEEAVERMTERLLELQNESETESFGKEWVHTLNEFWALSDAEKAASYRDWFEGEEQTVRDRLIRELFPAKATFYEKAEREQFEQEFRTRVERLNPERITKITDILISTFNEDAG